MTQFCNNAINGDSFISSENSAKIEDKKLDDDYQKFINMSLNFTVDNGLTPRDCSSPVKLDRKQSDDLELLVEGLKSSHNEDSYDNLDEKLEKMENSFDY